MTAPTKPSPNQRTNAAGLERTDYGGAPTTLCPGCGHNSISSQIIAAAFELSLRPHEVIKLSGIGCSSKSPAYFLGRSHGINMLHGRMPSVATGALVANRSVRAIGVSGDGDTGSIGFGQFKHIIRRNVPMVYIIENNGVYGLTKGQFSATSDQGQELKYAGVNEFLPIDLCAEAILSGAGFVARSFAGDAKQVRELLKAAISFNGIAILDIISPCVTFNNHDASTKSYTWGKENEERLQDISFIQSYEEMSVEMAEGDVMEVRLHDGPVIQLRKLDRGYEPTSRVRALELLSNARDNQELLTGLIYIDESRPTLMDLEGMTQTPLSALSEEQLRPSADALKQVLESFTY